MENRLATALQAILNVDFSKELPATETTKIGDFLTHAAGELLKREVAVREREEAVHARESAVTLREDEVAKRLEAAISLEGVRKVVDLRPRRKLFGR